MTRLSELDHYASQWLHVNDLKGKAVRVQIQRWSLEEVRERDGQKVKKVALTFKAAKKRLLLNKSQGQAGEDAWGDLENWPGKWVVLQPATAPNGKPTIALVPLPPATPEAPETPAASAQDESSTQEPPASAEPQQQAPAATASAPGAPAAGGMTDAEAAELWQPTKRRPEPYPGYAG